MSNVDPVISVDSFSKMFGGLMAGAAYMHKIGGGGGGGRSLRLKAKKD